MRKKQIFLNLAGIVVVTAAITAFVAYLSGSVATPSVTRATIRSFPSQKVAVTDGIRLYNSSCQTCHGPGGVGGSANVPLNTQKLKVDFIHRQTLAVFIQLNMPENNPGSLTAQQSVALAYYIWTLAGKKGGKTG